MQGIEDPGIGTLSAPGTAEPPCYLSPSVISQWRWRFHIVRGGIDPRKLVFRPMVVGVCTCMKEFLIWGWGRIV